MKQLILLMLAVTSIQALYTVKLYDCGAANKSFQFYDTVELWAQRGKEQYFYGLGGITLQPMSVWYYHVRVYGAEPDFNTFENARVTYEYAPEIYPQGIQLKFNDWAELDKLPKATYKIQVDLFDRDDNKVGCGAFYTYLEYLENQE